MLIAMADHGSSEPRLGGDRSDGHGGDADQSSQAQAIRDWDGPAANFGAASFPSNSFSTWDDSIQGNSMESGGNLPSCCSKI